MQNLFSAEEHFIMEANFAISLMKLTGLQNFDKSNLSKDKKLYHFNMCNTIKGTHWLFCFCFEFEESYFV